VEESDMKKINWVIAIALVMLLSPLEVQAATEINRLAGATRIETAIQIAESGWGGSA
jgi:hypothetical protein